MVDQDNSTYSATIRSVKSASNIKNKYSDSEESVDDDEDSYFQLPAMISTTYPLLVAAKSASVEIPKKSVGDNIEKPVTEKGDKVEQPVAEKENKTNEYNVIKNKTIVKSSVSNKPLSPGKNHNTNTHVRRDHNRDNRSNNNSRGSQTDTRSSLTYRSHNSHYSRDNEIHSKRDHYNDQNPTNYRYSK